MIFLDNVEDPLSEHVAANLWRGAAVLSQRRAAHDGNRGSVLPEPSVRGRENVFESVPNVEHSVFGKYELHRAECDGNAVRSELEIDVKR